MKNPYEIGESIYLRSLEAEDIEGPWYEWFSDYELTKFLGDRFLPNSKKKQADFFNSINDHSSIIFAIIDKETDKHIGVCSLSGVNWFHRYSDIALIMGSKEPQHKVVAIEAMRLLLNIAFVRLKLLNLRASYAVTNLPSATLLSLFRFEKVGLYKNLCYFDGKYTDVGLSQLTRSDWLVRNSLNLDD